MTISKEKDKRMKTATEWTNEINVSNETPLSVIEEASHNPITEEQIRKIQLDAWKQGANTALRLIADNLKELEAFLEKTSEIPTEVK